MPYKRIEPAPFYEMTRQRYKGHFSVCEKLREIYQETDDENIKEKARLALAMAKRMHFHMKDYKAYRESGLNKEEIIEGKSMYEPPEE